MVIGAGGGLILLKLLLMQKLASGFQGNYFASSEIAMGGF